MESLRGHARTLAWVFAALAVTANTASAFGLEGSTFDALRFIVSVMFTLFLLVAIGEWLRARRQCSGS